VDCTFVMAEHPSRIARIDARLALPPGFPERRRTALMAAVDGCTVQNTMRQPPEVRIELAQPAPVA
jgi:hypothetical protein